MIVDYDDCSLILLPDASLANTVSGASRVLSAMVEEMLSTVKSAAVVQVELDALVREAKRLSDDKGEKMSDDNIRAFNLFLRAAVAGHSEAQFLVSACYKHGRGIQENLAEAERWLRKAAANEFPRALLFLGLAYRSGNLYQNIAKDEEEAIKWLRKAAEGGFPGAYLALISQFSERKNYREVVNCYIKCADQGSTTCLFYPEVYYSDPADAAEALKWYRKAAEDGSASAQYHLGERYEVGRGVPQSDTEAAGWFCKAAAGWFLKATEKGDQHAQSFLGHCYAVGKGVPLELPQAHAWFQLASDQGQENAKKEIASLRNR